MLQGELTKGGPWPGLRAGVGGLASWEAREPSPRPLSRRRDESGKEAKLGSGWGVGGCSCRSLMDSPALTLAGS